MNTFTLETTTRFGDTARTTNNADTTRALLETAWTHLEAGNLTSLTLTANDQEGE